jgi:hypothetical protein
MKEEKGIKCSPQLTTWIFRPRRSFHALFVSFSLDEPSTGNGAKAISLGMITARGRKKGEA